MVILANELVKVVIEEFVIFSPLLVGLFGLGEQPTALRPVFLVVDDGLAAGNRNSFATGALTGGDVHSLLPVDRVLEEKEEEEEEEMEGEEEEKEGEEEEEKKGEEVEGGKRRNFGK